MYSFRTKTVRKKYLRWAYFGNSTYWIDVDDIIWFVGNYTKIHRSRLKKEDKRISEKLLVIRIGARVSAAVGPLPADRPPSGRRRRETWTGLVLASMPEKSWLIVWDQSGKSSIHSRRSLKFLEMSSISESEINALHTACIDATRPVAQSIPPTHHATLAIPPPLQSAAGTAAIQQNHPQPVILPAARNPQPVLLPEDERIPAETVIPPHPQHQQAKHKLNFLVLSL